MRQFREEAGVSTSYIHDIEKDRVLPNLERTKELAAVFTKVAAEQGAADPEDDARQLIRARERTLFTDRLGIAPELAELLVAVLEAAASGDVILSAFAEFNPREREALIESLRRALEIYKPLPAEYRTKVRSHIERIARLFDSSADDEQRRELVMLLAEKLDYVLDDVEKAAETARDETAQTA